MHEGDWSIENGALVNRDGGLITLNVPPGGRFSMELDIAFPSNWMSVILFFTKPESYGTLYFANGYWESFEIEGTEVADYVQHRDPEIVTTNGYHHIRVVSEYGLVALYYDGKFRGLTAFPYRPGSCVGFRSLPRSGRLSIQNFRLRKLPPAESRTVLQLSPEDFLQGVIHQDQGVAERPSQTDRLAVDANMGTASLQYGFTADGVFESCFVQIPTRVAACNTVLLEVDGDQSENNFFLIVHDASGEQHLILKTVLAWQGWQEVGVNLGTFLESPKNLERRAIHWGGDHNQKIDFPLQAMDLGVAKRGGRVKDRGKIRFRKVRFLE